MNGAELHEALDDDPDGGPMCEECPAAKNDPADGVPCPFWLRGQPCPGPMGAHA